MSVVTPLDARGRPAPVRIRRPSDRRSCSRSATRAIDVLELIGARRRPLRAVEISQALAMHPSTTNQLLKTMVDSAHLLFDARAMTYRPSPRLVAFGGWMVETYGREERLLPLLRDIGDRTGMIATISTANDLFMQIIEMVGPADQANRRGQRISVFGSATGSAYLSLLDQAEITRLAERARIGGSEVAGLCADARAIREQGHAHGPNLPDDREAIPTTWSIAMPLSAAAMPIRLVLGLAGPTDSVRGDLAALTRTMREARDRAGL